MKKNESENEIFFNFINKEPEDNQSILVNVKLFGVERFVSGIYKKESSSLSINFSNSSALNIEIKKGEDLKWKLNENKSKKGK